MQSSSFPGVHPEAILQWLHKEMGYRQSSLPSIDSIRNICRGNMMPIWNFLLTQVKSEKTVENIRKNIHVHVDGKTDLGKEERSKSVRKANSKMVVGGESNLDNREAALRERELAEKEVERLRHVVSRQKKELKAKMLEISREEAERKRMLDERSNYRHKQVMLEVYDKQCDEASRIFAEYHKRLFYYVNQARDAKRSNLDSSVDVTDSFHSTVKSVNSADDIFLIESTRERNIQKACEILAGHMIDKVRSSFPAYEGSGIHSNPQLEVSKLCYDFDGEIPTDVRDVILNCLRNPSQLLRAITTYTLRLKTLITGEIEKIDVRADAETLRYKYENKKVINTSSLDANSQLQYQFYGNGKNGTDVPSRGINNQLLERQKVHVQQFLATEDALNKAAEARNLSQKLIRRIHESGDVVSSQLLGAETALKNVGSLRQLELEVWAKERETAGLRSSLNTLTFEMQRLNKLCAERKEAEDSLKKKQKKIDEFDARRSELESIYTALIKANADAAAFWNQHPLAAREFSAITIVPACSDIVDISNRAKDLIDEEISAFYQCPDNSFYVLPSTSQALLESMGFTGSSGPEVIISAEKNAAMLTARAGSRDPSAVPSICRVSATLQYPSGLESWDAGLASVLESLEFCLKLRCSEASVLEDLVKAINFVHVRRDLVESGHALLNHAYHAQKEYDRTTRYCLKLAAEQEDTISEKWLPELKTAFLHAQKGLDDCKYVRGLLSEWWEQPAGTVIDWVTVDGQNVSAWHNHVKQLLTYYDKQLL